MEALKPLENIFLRIKLWLQKSTFHSILDLVNFFPSLAGFSLKKDNFSVLFFVMHFSLLTYIYGVGCVVYQVREAHSARQFIKSFVNVSLLTLIANNSYWFLMQRSLLKLTLSEMWESDKLARRNPDSCLKHEKMVSKIKNIIFILYSSNIINCCFIYLPNRVNVDVNNYSMTRCYGMEPLTASPNREICSILLFVLEICIIALVLNYQALLIFVITHTALLYNILSEEVLALNNFDQKLHFINPIAKDVLPNVFERHTMILSIIDKFKALYSVPIGINFGSNAVCISLFFYLPLEEWLQFMPIFMYCFLVFFLYCFLCQRLMNAAEYFESSVYACGWENFESKEKKAILIILQQAQKPVELLAAGIIPVNISTFATTLQAMYKFVTVVKF